MIRKTFQPTVALFKFINFQQRVQGNYKDNGKFIKTKLSYNQIHPLLHNNKFYFFKNDVTIDYRKNYYEILKVNENATLMDIKKSFYKLAKQSHPDTSKGNEDLFKQINEAYNVLSHQQRRKLYDTNRFRPASQNPNDQKAKQQQNRSSTQNQQNNDSYQQAYKQSQQYAQRTEEAYYHYSRGQWQQFRSGYKYHINPESQYYANLTNNVSNQKTYSNFKRKFQAKTKNQQKFLEQMERYFEYQQKIKNKQRKDLEEYHKKMEQLQRQMFQEKKKKFLDTFVGKTYSKIVNQFEKISQKLQSYLTKEKQK